jgi:hypothetical protein
VIGYLKIGYRRSPPPRHPTAETDTCQHQPTGAAHRHTSGPCAYLHTCKQRYKGSYTFANDFKMTYFFYYWWGGTKSLGTAATSGLLYTPQMMDEDDFWSNWWNKNWQGKPKCSEKTCPSATLSTTKSHMTRPGLELRAAAVRSQRLTA